MNAAADRDVVDVEIESLNAAGDGVARRGRDRFTVPFTIPGERVRILLTRGQGARDAAATLVAVLDPSPHRVVPRCPHFGPPSPPRGRGASGALPSGPDTGNAAGAGPCGGCAWQHIAYPEQLRLKTALVTRLVREAVRTAPAARPMLAGTPDDDPWGYRQKVHFVFDQQLRMGHYVRGSRRVIPVRECPVHDERGNRLAFTLRDTIDRSSRSRRPDSPLESVAIRVGYHSPEIMATLVVASDTDRRLRAATRRVIDSDAAPTSFHLNLHPRADGFIFGRETRRLTGPERLREDVAGTSFLISPTAFFQTNVRAAEILVRQVVDAVPKGAAVLDLYAGAGLFALPLARAGHEVVAVEENRTAVADGEASLRLNRIPPAQCRFIPRPVEAVLGGTPGRRSEGVRLPGDVVIMDPPRQGCGRTVLDRVFGGIRPRVAVYVSCNPEALARDLGIVSASGYRIQSLQPVDMFPHTAHVETVAVLTR